MEYSQIFYKIGYKFHLSNIWRISANIFDKFESKNLSNICCLSKLLLSSENFDKFYKKILFYEFGNWKGFARRKKLKKIVTGLGLSLFKIKEFINYKFEFKPKYLSPDVTRNSIIDRHLNILQLSLEIIKRTRIGLDFAKFYSFNLNFESEVFHINDFYC